MKWFPLILSLFVACLAICSVDGLSAAEKASNAVSWYDTGVGLETSAITPKQIGIAVGVILAIYFFRGGTVAGLMAMAARFRSETPIYPSSTPPVSIANHPDLQLVREALEKISRADTVLQAFIGRGKLTGLTFKATFANGDPLEFKFGSDHELRIVNKE